MPDVVNPGLPPPTPDSDDEGPLTPVRVAPKFICDRCGARMIERSCKVVCNNCGNRFDCSDLNLYFD